MQGAKFITDEDINEYGKFCGHHFKHFVSFPTAPLYHYTSAANLLSILQSNQLWTTQVACLNDTEEYIYAVKKIRNKVQEKISENGACAALFKRMFEELGLIIDQVGLRGVFVASFSELGDDLSQWRAYGGGEGGCAIGFDSKSLYDLTSKQGIQDTYLVKVRYSEDDHEILFNDIIKFSESFYLKGLNDKKITNEEEWIEEFLRVWLWQLGPFAPCIKHPKFADEKEWRLIFYTADYSNAKKLHFMQKRGMMTHHFPLDFKQGDSPEKLPLREIIIGPNRHKEISKISAEYARFQYGYPESVEVKLTAVPYRET